MKTKKKILMLLLAVTLCLGCAMYTSAIDISNYQAPTCTRCGWHMSHISHGSGPFDVYANTIDVCYYVVYYQCLYRCNLCGNTMHGNCITQTYSHAWWENECYPDGTCCGTYCPECGKYKEYLT